MFVVRVYPIVLFISVWRKIIISGLNSLRHLWSPYFVFSLTSFLPGITEAANFPLLGVFIRVRFATNFVRWSSVERGLLGCFWDSPLTEVWVLAPAQVLFENESGFING